ncbi:TonB-dependent receptor [Kordiimonas sp. SCSIO 12603]|uniref:TonB-dependent receptor n=1 Tax=Kordiimonas sp. SCSIO 12603 TaxID=2829596 RepID=UPI0021046EB2|nr:TonB-dependent receptor [Kordiimonas sp. SCSIO 12603]UTW58749.1 TonB-dependent receptor [Kordiimonas sp. SCSIO 12603]
MDKREAKIRQYLLLGASAFALATANPAALAQTTNDDDKAKAEDEELEEIVVTGFKASLRSAQSLKENADTFIDAITAEDIGALADRSVAEALQRVPGINIGRFQKTSDPDRFSVEGADVVIRGLPFVRSEFNGRDVFSATGGRVLSFNDISPELLGAVKVFKATSADMIEGAISGVVDLGTRKPLDGEGFRIAGAIEGNYGDLAEEWSPGFSVVAANTWETSSGRFGLQLGYSQSELITRSDASQVTDPCYRAATLDGPCIRARSVSSAGVGDDTEFNAANFPPADSVVVPKGAGVRTTGYDRDRNAFSAVAQWENSEKNLLVTAEYLRAEADLFVDEHAILALVNDDALFPVQPEGSPWNFDQNGVFQSGVLSQTAWHGFNNCVPGTFDVPTGEFPVFSGPGQPCDIQDGIPTEFLRFQRDDHAVTEDISLDIQWSPTDRLHINLEAQHVDSTRTEDGVISATVGRSDIFLDLGSGATPNIEFRAPLGANSEGHFSNPDRFYSWFLIDSFIDNEGDLTTFRGDIDYDLNEESFFKRVKFGARWSDRNRVTRDNNFGNWGNLSNAWTWTDTPKNPVYASNPASQGVTNIRTPFAEFQRGSSQVPVPGGAGIFWGGDNLIEDYFSGTLQNQANGIIDAFGARIAETWGPVGDRAGLVGDSVYLPGEISDVTEKTQAFYARVDFGTNNVPGDGIAIEGNIGLRYVKTTIESAGEIQFPLAEFAPDADTSCSLPPGDPNAVLPPFCFLSPGRQAEFIEGFTGELLDDSSDIEFEHWLPSLNVKFGITEDLLVRAAVSKGISRPDLADFRTGGVIGSNLGTLQQDGTLETGPLFALRTGNRLLRPVTAWNYDLSVEWYFNRVGSLTASFFLKDISGLITDNSTIREFVSDTGATAQVRIDGPTNLESATVKGIELGYQQTFDFLPGPLKYLGFQGTYTYVDAGNLGAPENDVRRSAFADSLGFPGISKHTYNLTGFYEDAKLSVRLAYNWRSDFLLTPRDDIFPFSPIFGESTGQLDGSIFYNVTENIKVGIQAVNLLDEVTRTSQLIDFNGTRLPRTAFRNDRRFTFLVRFNF